MDLVVLKVIATAAVFVIAVMGIFASYKLKKFTKWFDIASAFSAGIIIATAYTHMLPEAIEQYDEYMTSHSHGHSHVHGHGDLNTTGNVTAPVVSGVSVPGGNASTPVAVPVAPKKKCNHAHHNHGHHDHDHVHEARRLTEVSADVSVDDGHDDHDHDHHGSYYPLIPFLAALSFLCLFLVERGAIMYMQNRDNHTHAVEEVKMANGQDLCHDECGMTCDSPPHHHHDEDAINCCKDIKSLEKMSELTALALIIAVSLHAVIEGMGMGAGKSTEGVVSTFIGVAVHKGLEGFAVGANLIGAAVSKRRFIMYSAVVCLASPLGALIGYLMTLGNARTGVVGPVLGALAVGTFIQVATMEFLPRTFAKQDHFWLKSMGLLAGFAVMSTMPIWFADTPHQHL